MIELYNTLLYQPLMNILIFLYQAVPGGDFGIAIIILTVLIRFLLYPLSAKGIKSQKAIIELQPEIKEIQEKYRDDKEKQVKEVLEVYKKAKVNPFSGFLPLLIQLPVLIALYQILWDVQRGEFAETLYNFIPSPGEINSVFLGFIDLVKVGVIDEGTFLFGNILIIVGAGLAQFFQMKMVMIQKSDPKKKKKKKGKPDPRADMMEKMQKQMVYFFPLFTVVFLFYLPLAIGLYWLTTTLFSLAQQHFILNKL